MNKSMAITTGLSNPSLMSGVKTLAIANSGLDIAAAPSERAVEVTPNGCEFTTGLWITLAPFLPRYTFESLQMSCGQPRSNHEHAVLFGVHMPGSQVRERALSNESARIYGGVALKTR